MADGALSRRIETWREDVLQASARIEALLDFADEDDVPDHDEEGRARALALAAEIRALLMAPSAERLRDGVRVVIAGPPNAGKSTLLNALAGREAAITSTIAGTTRDVIEAPVAIAGIPFVLTDTAGLRAATDEIERIGVDRAQAMMAAADIVLWLDDAPAPPDPRFLPLHARTDVEGREAVPAGRLGVSALTGNGVEGVVQLLIDRAKTLLPGEGDIALNQRQRLALLEAASALDLAEQSTDPLLIGETLRLARIALDKVTGRAGIEDMLDALFGRFCIGK